MYKITCTPIKNVFGKNTGEFKALFGEFSETGNTKQEARDKLNAALDWYFLDLDLPLHIKQTKMRVFILERSFFGYSVTGVNLGSRCTCGVMFGRVSDYEAQKHFDNYINQYLECTPDDSVVI